MKYINSFLLILLMQTTASQAQTYITNVTVADVKKQVLLPNRTVVITNDLITDISSKKINIPEQATVVDGSGKFLFPGLTDAHVHFFQNGGLYTRPDVIDLRAIQPYEKEMELAHKTMEDKLRRYLQNGITQVIDVGASYAYLQQREQYKNKAFSPGIFMTGPLLTTYQPPIYEISRQETPFSLVRSIEDGIKMVQEQLPYNPDFIKIWYIAGADGLTPAASAQKNLPIIKASIEEAHKHNLKVAVHATQRITAQLAVENGCDILVHSIDDELLKEDFIQLLKKKKTILCPTVVVGDGYRQTLGQNLQLSRHELLSADPFQLGSLMDLKHISDTALVNRYKIILNSAAQKEKQKKENDLIARNLKLLSDAGVLIATGTDAGNIGTLHAASYLRELQAMSAAGMSNWQIIQASTINGAKVLNRESEFGSIEKGKKANLLLLDANPVEKIENIGSIDRVINRGHILDPDTLLKETPEALAQRQLNAYNQGNIEAFLEPYAEDVEIYEFPDKLLEKGKAQMRKSYTEFFQRNPVLHCQLLGRTVKGNIVIDQEKVIFRGGSMEAIAIYQVENNQIKKVFFIQ
ncbi:amidohydrolase family protein [Flavihumibacter sp. CACIAM 22H1]|uniref:amidohydrolase family protein n=1 Tax=Flavihumibacter sp. CACIAM 22H1 TaxID=1812911 RepID=UPI0007A8A17C|nr:amidohydrolase family protein [Flavihumibacter sp. CACIAM 22H1]KYP13760.1 MAG: amidohydrolase [Flavihumibacter sp. CACIAM 22H1]